MLAKTRNGDIIDIVQKPHWVTCPQCVGSGRVAETEDDCMCCGGSGESWFDSYGFYHDSPHDFEKGLIII